MPLVPRTDQYLLSVSYQLTLVDNGYVLETKDFIGEKLHQHVFRSLDETLRELVSLQAKFVTDAEKRVKGRTIHAA
jgi:hypothetical protein